MSASWWALLVALAFSAVVHAHCYVLDLRRAERVAQLHAEVARRPTLADRRMVAEAIDRATGSNLSDFTLT